MLLVALLSSSGLANDSAMNIFDAGELSMFDCMCPVGRRRMVNPSALDFECDKDYHLKPQVTTKQCSDTVIECEGPGWECRDENDKVYEGTPKKKRALSSRLERLLAEKARNERRYPYSPYHGYAPGRSVGDSEPSRDARGGLYMSGTIEDCMWNRWKFPGLCQEMRSVDDSEPSRDARGAWGMVNFDNDPCIVESSLMIEPMKGTCMTHEDCEKKAGIFDGTCAEGFGVCCVVGEKNKREIDELKQMREVSEPFRKARNYGYSGYSTPGYGYGGWGGWPYGGHYLG